MLALQARSPVLVTWSASAGQSMPENSCCCCCGEKFKIEAYKPNMAIDHYITIAGNVKLRPFYLMTFDLGGHLRSL